MENIVNNLSAELDLAGIIRIMLIVAIGSLMLGIIGRVCFGKRSGLNHAVSSAMGILFVYAVFILIYTFNPAGLAKFLSPLPFVTFAGDHLYVLSLSSGNFPAICTEILNMVILAFLVNVLDAWIPKGKNIFSWYLLRFVTVLLAAVLQIVVTGLLSTYLPDVLVTYAPVILLGILAVLLLLGVLKVVLGLVLTITNPILGAIYTFFFSSMIGKMLGKAVVTTIIITALVYILEMLGFTVVSIAAAALAAYLPLIIVLLVMWYILGHVL